MAQQFQFKNNNYEYLIAKASGQTHIYLPGGGGGGGGSGGGIMAGIAASVAAGAAALGLGIAGHDQNQDPRDIEELTKFDKGEEPLKDSNGDLAFANYFEDGVADEDKVLKVSLATKLPQEFNNGTQIGDYLDSVVNNSRSHTTRVEPYWTTVCHTRGSGETTYTECTPELRTRIVTDHHHYSERLDIDSDFRPTTEAQKEQLEKYFEAFSDLTGIKVEVGENLEDANIYIGNFSNPPNNYRGRLDYVDPSFVASYPEGSVTDRGPGFERNVLLLNDMNRAHDEGLGEHIGRPLGFESGKVNGVTLRDSLKKMGFPVKALAVEDNVYDAENIPNVSPELVDKNVVADGGGVNKLIGTDGNDVLVVGEDECGYTKMPKNKLTNIASNGKKYCIAEGDISVVKGGEGDDLLIIDKGSDTTFETGPGDDRITLYRSNIGNATILSNPDEDGKNTLYLSERNASRGEIVANIQEGEMELNFIENKHVVGTVTLPHQTEGGGIDKIAVVKDNGDEIFKTDVKNITTAQEMNEKVLEPMAQEVKAHIAEQNAQAAPGRWSMKIQDIKDIGPKVQL